MATSMAGRQALWAVAGQPRRRLVGTFTTSATVLLPAAESSRKSSQVERAIRVKSQAKRRENRGVLQDGSFGEDSRAKQSRQQAYRGSGSSRKESMARSMLREDLGDGQYTPGKRRTDRGRISMGGNESGGGSTRRNDSWRHSTKSTSTGSARKRGPWSEAIKDVSAREARFRVAQQLNILIRDRNKTAIEAFEEGLALFSSLSGFDAREGRIYTAMIRLAMKAKKHTVALGYITEMKKNGVATTAHIYRAVFEGMRQSSSDGEISKDAKVVQKVKGIFDDMETQWRAIPIDLLRGEDGDGEDVELEVVESGTAKSYRLSKASAAKDMMLDPSTFVAACSHYLAFLCDVEDYDEVMKLINRVEDIACPPPLPKSAEGDLPIVISAPTLPYILSSRYLFQRMTTATDLVPGENEVILACWRHTMNTLQNPASLNKLRDVKWQGDVTEVSRVVHVGLANLVKYTIPGRQEIASSSLKTLYSVPYLAELPPVIYDQSLKNCFNLVHKEPDLYLTVFEAAVDYHESIYRSNGEAVGPDASSRNFTWSWLWALKSAARMKDTSKALALLERLKSNMEWPFPYRLVNVAKPFYFQESMQLCHKVLDWDAGLKVWRYWFDMRVIKGDQVHDDDSTISVAKQFLGLACSLESEAKRNPQATDDQSESVRYAREALRIIDGTIGFEGEVWKKWEEKCRQVEPLSAVFKNLSQETSNLVTSLINIRRTCKHALDTGPQGVDLADKDEVIKWKELQRRAVETLAKIEVERAYDDTEAKWLRSGVNSKGSLALTNADIRQMLREEDDEADRGV